MPKARAKKSKFIVRKSKKTGKQIKLYGAPMAKVLASEKLRKRRNGAKRRRNLDHRDAQHPIEVSKYWQGRKGYKTQWQRAHEGGQRQLFAMNPAVHRTAGKVLRKGYANLPELVNATTRAGYKGKKELRSTGTYFVITNAEGRKVAVYKMPSANPRRNARKMTSRKPFDAIIGATPAAQFASTLGLANPGRRGYGARRRRTIKSGSFTGPVRGGPSLRGNKMFWVYEKLAGNQRRLLGRIETNTKAKALKFAHQEWKPSGSILVSQREYLANPAKRRNPLGAMLLGVNGRGAARRKTNRRRRNGEGGLFEEFHGRPADGYKVGLAPIGTPKDTEFLGKLECIEYRNGSKSEMSFGHGDHDQPDLVANRTGKHLYLVGDIPCWPDKADQFHGYVTRIEYHAIKDHIDGGIKTLYFHKVGEETGALPELWTDAEGYLVLKGGEYYVTADGIIN